MVHVPTRAEIIGCVFTSFLVFSLVEARHKHVTCLGGRQEGDKWFDGCKWCVCQSSGPLCSPAQCSDLTRRVPPCTNLGSRWRDGCYECQCHKHGIECHADRACVILMQMEAYQRQVMTPGACVHPKDDRCVCGVDGVPSCTVEVIDRDAHPATTIAFDVSLPYASKDTLSGMADDIDPYEARFDTGRDEEYRYPEVDEGDLKRSRPIRRHKKTETSSEKGVGYPPTSGVQNDDWSTETRAGGSLRKISEDLFGSTRQRDHKSSRHDALEFDYDKSKEPTASSSNQRRRGVVYGEPFSTYLDGLREGSRPHHRRTHRYRRNADRKWRLANVRNSKGQLVHVPGSLLVITDNRCRYGIRWYGGGLRCFCDEEGSVTCGDPSFVASRIDGFRLEKLPCEEGHAWEEHGSCQVCDCQISGVVLCRRSESCPLPFLIRPVTYADETYESETHTENEDENDEEGRISKRKPRQKFIDFNLEDKSRDRPSDKTMLEVNSNPGFKLDRVKDPDPDTGRTRSLYHTTVIVRECKPGSRWMDGCKRCFCNNGRKQCDDRHCLKPRPPSQAVGSTPQTIRDKINGRPFQRPPSVSVIRERPVSIKSPFGKNNSCEGHKVRQIYWVKCNLCVCTSGGPRCTAKSCG